MSSQSSSKKSNQKRKIANKTISSSEQMQVTKSAAPKESPQSKKSTQASEVNLREPWIKRKNGIISVVIISLALAVLVAYQIIRGSGNWGQGILWGAVFGGSILLIFFGMTWFHSLFNKGKDQKQNSTDKK